MLNNTRQVKEALKDSMIGNVESDYRIDGWSSGLWFEGPSISNATELRSEEHSFMSAMKARSLSMNLEDGSILADRHINARIGFICQGDSGVGQSGCQGQQSKFKPLILACSTY